MSRLYTSASSLYLDLVGDAVDTEFALDEPTLDPKGLHDLYELMWDDDSSASDSDESVEQKAAPSPASTSTSAAAALWRAVAAREAASPSECSICYCEFDSLVTELECSHRFCQACVELYLKLTISEAPLLHHKRSFTRRDGIAISISQRELVGVRCPHFACQGVIQEQRIRRLVDGSTYDKFDRFALEQSLVKMMHKKELVPCPFACGRFTQDECLCVNPDCRTRQIRLREREKKKLAQLMALVDSRFEQWAVRNTDLVRLCPLCSTHIEKNGGCDHMYCASCKQAFLWSKALPFRSPSHWMQKAKAEIAQRKAKLPPGVIVDEPAQ